MASRPIDEKIVAMKMDNSDFKRKASETVGIFGKLGDSLSKVKNINMSSITGAIGKMKDSLSSVGKISFSKINDSLASVKTAAGRVDMSQLASNVDNVAGRFTNLNTIATTALATITAKATIAGSSLLNSLGPAQVSGGFQEYEQKMGSIGTMLSNTEWDGSTLEDVKKTLGTLNDYADNTVYSFGQMTDNIGRFTAAGVTLDDSATAIKGLGNLAAASGSNTDQLNTAMYQMSQAMASGKLNLMDWNSMVNAGMGGKKTQDALLETAKAMGHNVDMSDGFRNSIEQGWLTSEVFLTTLKKFGNDKSMSDAAQSVRTFSGMMDSLKEGIGSGWAESFEIIFGDFNEATKLWTGISNLLKGVFDKQSDMRNAVLKSVFDGGGLKNLFGGIKNVAAPVIQVFKAIGAGFKMAFPDSAASVIGTFLEMFQYFTKSLTLSGDSVNNIKTIFAGFFSIFAIGFKIIQGAVGVIVGLLPSFSGLGAKILELIAAVAQIPLGFNNATNSTSAFASGMSVVKKVAGFIADALTFAVGGIIVFVQAISMAIDVLARGDFRGGPWDEDSWIVTKLLNIRHGVENMVAGVKQAWSILTGGSFKGGPWEDDSKIVDFISKFKDGFSGIKDFIGDIDFGAMASSFGNFVSAIGDGIAWIIDKAKTVGAAIKDMIPSGEQLLAGGVIAGMLAIVGSVLKVVWQMFTGWGNIGAGVTETLDSVSGALNGFTTGLYVNSLLTIAIALGILAGALWLLSDVPGEQLAKTLSVLVASLGALVGAMWLMTKYDIAGTGMKAAIQIVALAVAFAILSVAMRTLSGMSWEEIAKGIIGLVGVIGVFAGAVALMSKFGGAKVGATSLQLVVLAATVHILFSAVQKMATVPVGDLVKGTATLSAILLALALFLKIAGGSGFGMGAALGILGVTAAILIVVVAITSISLIPTDVIVKGLITITAILAALALFSVVVGPGLLSAGVGVALIAGALLLLTIPISILGNMDLKTLAVGIGAIAVVLVAIGAASMLMTGMVAAGIGLALVAASLILLLIPISAFAAMSWEGLLKGMTGLALTLLILGGAAALLTPVIPSMIAFGLALVVIGAGVALAGAGIALFATGMVTAAAMTGTAVLTLVSMLGTLIGGLVSLIPVAVDFGVKVITHIGEAFDTHGPVLFEKLLGTIMKMLTIFDENIPQFTAKAGDIITAFIDGMAIELPRIVLSITNLMVDLAAAVEANKAPFQNAFLSIMTEVSVMMVTSGAAVIDALFGWIPGVGEVTSQIGEAAETNIREAFDAQKVATDKGSEFAGGLSGTSGAAGVAGQSVGASAASGAGATSFNPIGATGGQGFVSGLLTQTTSALGAGTALGNNAEGGASTANLNPMGSTGGQGFVSGLLTKTGVSQNAGVSLGNSAEGGASTANLNPIGSGHGTAFASGVGSKVSAASTSGTSIANGAKSGASSVDVSSVGTNFGQGFANGISGMRDRVVTAARGIAAAASATLKYVLDTHSPSKVTTKIGEDTGQGFANGIANKKKKAEEAAKKVAEAAVKAYSNSKEYIDNKKYYNEYGLSEELEAWEKVQKRYKQGSEQRKDADKEVYRLKNAINKELIATNDDYVAKVQEANKKLIADEKALNDEYKKSLADRAKSLSGFAGLFDKVETDSEVSGAVLLENLKGQVTTFTDWKNNLQALGKRKGLYSGLLTELTEMGPKAADEIAALNAMTNEQLQEYSELWGQKNQLAVNEAERELKPLKDSTTKEIKALRSATAKELDLYKKEWLAKIKEIRYGTANEFVGLKTSMQTIGSNAISGMIKGMKNMSTPLAQQAKALADSIAKTIKTTLKIKSPSRVAMGLGSFFGQGLSNGIASQAKAVMNSSKHLAVTAKDSLNRFIEGFEVGPEDNEIHFKAVVDYDGFKPGVGLVPVGMMPDTSRTSNLIRETKASVRQNGNTLPKEAVTNSTTNDYKYDIHVNANGTMSRTEVRKLAVQIRDEIKNVDDRGRISNGREVAF